MKPGAAIALTVILPGLYSVGWIVWGMTKAAIQPWLDDLRRRATKRRIAREMGWQRSWRRIRG